METSELDAPVQPSRKPPTALILINRPEDGIYILSLEDEDLRLLKQILNWAGYQSVLVDVDDDVDRIDDAVVLHKPTIIINLVEQMFGDERLAPSVAGMLDLFGYVYTGSEPSVLFDCMYWSRTMVLLEHSGLPLGADTAGAMQLHACLLGNDEVECLPICQTSLVDGAPEVTVPDLDVDLVDEIKDLAERVWYTLGLRDVGQIDFTVSPAGRVSICGVVAAVDLFGEVFRTAASSREGGLPGSIVKLARLCHERLSPDELEANPLPFDAASAESSSDESSLEESSSDETAEDESSQDS